MERRHVTPNVPEGIFSKAFRMLTFFRGNILKPIFGDKRGERGTGSL